MNYKILHYVVGFSTLSETFIYDLIKGLEDRKISSNLIVCRKRTLEYERPFPYVKVLKQSNFFKRLSYKLTDPQHMQLQEDIDFLQTINEFNPDIIHAHFSIAGIRISNFLEKHSLNIPMVASFHGSDILSNPSESSIYLQNLLKLNNRKDLTMTVPSNFLKSECLKLGLKEEKIQVMYNTVNKMFLNSKQAESWDGEGPLKIVIVGRLVPMKGHEIALKALAQLNETFSKFELHILGEGRTREDLERLTSELGLSTKVTFYGAVGHVDLLNLLSRFHISLTPSIRAADGQEESFCISLIEASSCGLYCIASDAGGPNEVLEGNPEYIYSQKDSEALKDKILEYVNNPEIRQKRTSDLQEYVKEKFHPDGYFERYDRFYRSLIAKE